ncbi:MULTISPECIES: phospholipase D-like domain-containing protein [Bacillaceae]|uniref:phospholipase D-like domain-containing protein n=1 Tax=Bacillaceae TaxID=186817 RepID=UPI00053AA4D9|nr:MULTISPECIES: phospholipase D-like domain-containing protein [Bacillaceae]MEC5272092.1 phospholipase D-like domain-containing protein [Caldifermentibacillus hisashii]
MSTIINGISGDLILSEGEYGYKPVIDDFENANFINIVTYNITSFEDAELIQEIRKVDKHTPINIILNIPSRYKGKKLTGTAKTKAVEQTYYYLKTLERNKFGDLNVYFNFRNHAKLIMTNNIAYIGSQNFSDASSENIELGFIISEPSSINYINSKIFEKIKSKSFRYATSDYTVKMEEIANVMSGLIEEIRYNIFTIVGDEPYIPEIEAFDIERAYFPKDKWEEFKELHQKFDSIIEELKDNYSEVFNGTKADKLVDGLNVQLENFVLQLDDLAIFIDSRKESMIWDKFWELDDGEDLDKTLEIATSQAYGYKQERFGHLNSESDELIKTFDSIAIIISGIAELIEEIKFEMLKVTVYENEEIINMSE